jgi:16S rRNA (guanine(527)-N(7))-methyltransferase RsmG
VNHVCVRRAATWAGVAIDHVAEARLDQCAEWLVREAIPAGGVGPGEEAHVEERHIADSLLFAWGWRNESPERVLDIGSGVGLPALPLAITHPDVEFTALDRAGRRVRLLKRAIRVLGLSNVTVLEGDVRDVSDRYPAVVSRAAIPPAELLPFLRRTVASGGCGVVGGSRAEQPAVDGYETVEIPSEVLDRPAWILIMAQS